MATTTFTDGSTVIVASWLNDIDALVYDIFDGPDTLVLHAKGDVLASTGSSIQLVNVGSNNQVLTADSSRDAGVKWAAAASGDVVDDTSPQLGGPLDPNGKFIGMDKGEDVASGTPTIGEDGDYFDITGTTTISAFAVAANRHFFCQFDAALQLTHNSTDLDLPGEANITTAAGDVAEFFSTGTNDVQCVNYTKANGKAVAGSDVVDDASPQLGGSLDCQSNDITAVDNLQVTTIKDASGNNPSIPSAIAEGRAKCWIMMTGTGTVAVDDSFNVASITDSGGGRYVITIDTDFGNVNYCWAGMAQQDGSDDRGIILSQEEDAGPAAGSLAITTQNDAGSYVDTAGIGVVMFGDQ